MEKIKKVLAVSILVIFLGIVYGFCQETKLPELIPYRKGNKWGFCDRNKKIVIPVKYDDIGFLSEEFVSVKLNNMWGFVDKKGNEIIPLKL